MPVLNQETPDHQDRVPGQQILQQPLAIGWLQPKLRIGKYRRDMSLLPAGPEPAQPALLEQKGQHQHVGVKHCPDGLRVHGRRAQVTASATPASLMPSSTSRMPRPAPQPLSAG